MVLNIYDCANGNTVFEIEIPVKEVQAYIDLIKSHGVEDDEMNEYKFRSVQILKDYIYINVEA